MFRKIFLIYIILFYAISQRDVVNYILSSWYGHPVPYYPVPTAILLAGIAILLAGWGERLLRKYSPRHSHDTFPVYVITGWLVTLSVSYPFADIPWYVISILIGILAIVFEHWWYRGFRLHTARLYGAIPPSSSSTTGHTTPKYLTWRHFLPCAVRLLILCPYIGIAAAATETTHYELRTAQALMSDRPQRAYHIGEQSLATSPRLFALRCYLIATTDPHGLGDKLFEQPVPAGGSRNLLLPHDDMQAALFPTNSLTRLLGGERSAGESLDKYLARCARIAWYRTQRNPAEAPLPAVDYYLSSLLLDRRLDDYAREVRRFYPRRVAQGKLPRYFAEALLLYTRQRTAPSVIYHDSAIEANYQDYSDMGDTIANPVARANLLRRNYGETYRWWYEYAK